MKSIVRIPGLAAGFVLAGALASSAASAPKDPGHAAHAAHAANTAGMASFRGNPEHTGVYASPALRLPWQVRWRFPTGGPVRSSPVLAGGTIYVGSGDGTLRAVDPGSGKERWRFPAGGAVDSTPAVAGGTVFVAARDRRLYALDAATGRERWRFALGDDLPFEWGWDYYLSSPVVADGRVFVGSGDGHLYAVDAGSGREIWKWKTGGRVRSSPAVAAGRVYVGSMDGRLYALDVATGKLAWKYDTEGTTLDSAKFRYDRTSVQSSPAVAGGLVVFGCRDGFLYAVDARSGERKWRFDHQTSWVITAPAIDGGLVLAGSSDGHFFQALDLATGQEKWHHPTDNNVFSSGAVAGGVVYFGTWDGTLYALDVQTGNETARFRLGTGMILSSPLVADGTLYFGSDDGTLYALAGGRSTGTGKAAVHAPAKRAVYWNEKAVGKWFKGDVPVRDFFVAAGYQLLGTTNLADFLRERAADPAPSVIVFASDGLPDTVAPKNAEAPLLKQYLEKGGKVVWLGAFPILYDLDPQTGVPLAADTERTSRLLGVTLSKGVFKDEYGAQVTPAGARWGLHGWWVANRAVPVGEVTTVLALDDNGKAAAWVKNYGGPEGSGFVRLWGRQDQVQDLISVEAAAEHGLE
ncbi:MAG TPA: PQQ-binding-like beta-propeller repeat protein [Thermoanaerobaculia bacterium]|nr:PQQ-binding-like beta-propeller repeat protein [Thermoanaerobaculia bacterium]